MLAFVDMREEGESVHLIVQLENALGHFREDHLYQIIGAAHNVGVRRSH